ncbi:hypothetical protein DPSP01_014250 [Paraphaeosphaeria sporulosa]
MQAALDMDSLADAAGNKDNGMPADADEATEVEDEEINADNPNGTPFDAIELKPRTSARRRRPSRGRTHNNFPLRLEILVGGRRYEPEPSAVDATPRARIYKVDCPDSASGYGYLLDVKAWRYHGERFVAGAWFYTPAEAPRNTVRNLPAGYSHTLTSHVDVFRTEQLEAATGKEEEGLRFRDKFFSFYSRGVESVEDVGWDKCELRQAVRAHEEFEEKATRAAEASGNNADGTDAAMPDAVESPSMEPEEEEKHETQGPMAVAEEDDAPTEIEIGPAKTAWLTASTPATTITTTPPYAPIPIPTENHNLLAVLASASASRPRARVVMPTPLRSTPAQAVQTPKPKPEKEKVVLKLVFGPSVATVPTPEKKKAMGGKIEGEKGLDAKLGESFGGEWGGRCGG